MAGTICHAHSGAPHTGSESPRARTFASRPPAFRAAACRASLRTCPGREVDGWARTAVRDQGPGIAPGVQQHVFVFERFERGATAGRAGYGLGLRIVQELVRLHGGEVAVEIAAGRGTTFVVTLALRRD
jgi:signal transduction histidine kinase